MNPAPTTPTVSIVAEQRQGVEGYVALRVDDDGVELDQLEPLASSRSPTRAASAARAGTSSRARPRWPVRAAPPTGPRSPARPAAWARRERHDRDVVECLRPHPAEPGSPAPDERVAAGGDDHPSPGSTMRSIRISASAATSSAASRPWASRSVCSSSSPELERADVALVPYGCARELQRHRQADLARHRHRLLGVGDDPAFGDRDAGPATGAGLGLAEPARPVGGSVAGSRRGDLAQPGRVAARLAQRRCASRSPPRGRRSRARRGPPAHGSPIRGSGRAGSRRRAGPTSPMPLGGDPAPNRHPRFLSFGRERVGMVE